jgi:NADPH:quinone reductase
MTKSVRAAFCTSLTGPQSVHIAPMDRMTISNDAVRINVKAVGLGFPDLLMTYGQYQFRPEPPFIPGSELAGTIIECGPDVTAFKVGDRVMGGTKGGCLCEEIVLPTQSIAPLPDSMSFEEGACWTSGAITAWHALHDRADIQSGESILILGAGGGVGLAAVQLARYKGALVIGTGSTPEKREVILAHGADHVFDPADPDLAQMVKSVTGGQGVNVVFDPVGGDLAITATRAIAWGGRYLIVGFASGVVPKFPANHALIKGYSLMGLRAGESARRDPALAQATHGVLSGLASAGIMRPHISHRFSLDQAAEAFAVIEDKKAIGRVVVVI